MTSTRSALPELQLNALNFTVGHWTSDRTTDNIDLNAPYQRASVWTIDQRQALIKSLIMGLPVGSIIVSVLPVRNKFHYRVIDGKQRVETVRAFVGDLFTVPGWWFQQEDTTTRDDDVLFSELTQRGQRTLEMGRALPALEFKGEREWLGRDEAGVYRHRTRTDQELLKAEAEVYLLINGAGTAQSDDDMARADAIAKG